MLKYICICIILLNGLAIKTVAISASVDMKGKNIFYFHYLIEEGIRTKTTAGFFPCNPPNVVKANSQELFLGGIRLNMTTAWQLRIDSSEHTIINVKVLDNSHSSFLIKKLKSGRSFNNESVELFGRANLEGLNFKIIIKPKTIQVVIERSCIPKLLNKWPTDPVLGEKPLSFREGFPVLQRCLSTICRELFQFSQPGVKWPLPDKLVWKEKVRANCFGRSVGVLQIMGKLKKPLSKKEYILSGKYFDNNRARVNVGNIGTLKMKFCEEQGVRLPEQYIIKIMSYAVGAPIKNQIRLHEKELAIKLEKPVITKKPLRIKHDDNGDLNEDKKNKNVIELNSLYNQYRDANDFREKLKIRKLFETFCNKLES